MFDLILVADVVTPMAADGGVVEWLNSLTADIESLLVAVASVVAIWWVVKVAFGSKFAIPAIAIAMAMSGVFLWYINDGTTDAPDLVDNEFNNRNSAPAVVVPAEDASPNPGI